MARDSAPPSNSGALRPLIFLALAVFAGMGAFYMLYQLITSYQERIEEAKRPEDTVMVIVAARDLYQGVTITEDDLFAVQIPPKYLPKGVYLSPEYVVGRIPRERILGNEFVRADRLADPEDGVGLNAIIPRGMRAISINIADGAALSGFLNPGNYVDVLVTIQPDGEFSSSSARPRTETLEQAIFVLGVNSRIQKETAEKAKERGPNRPSVTLLVTADQAERIAHAENMGDIVLTLRNDLDVIFNPLPGVDINGLRTQIKQITNVKVRAKKQVEKKICKEMKMVSGKTSKIILVDEFGVPCN